MSSFISVQRIYFTFELLSIAPLSGRLMNILYGILIVDVLLQNSPLQKWECFLISALIRFNKKTCRGKKKKSIKVWRKRYQSSKGVLVFQGVRQVALPLNLDQKPDCELMKTCVLNASTAADGSNISLNTRSPALKQRKKIYFFSFSSRHTSRHSFNQQQGNQTADRCPDTAEWRHRSLRPDQTVSLSAAPLHPSVLRTAVSRRHRRLLSSSHTYSTQECEYKLSSVDEQTQWWPEVWSSLASAV